MGFEKLKFIILGLYKSGYKEWHQVKKILRSTDDEGCIANDLYKLTGNSTRIVSEGKDLYEELTKQDIKFLVKGEIPQPLLQIQNPPVWLFVKGNTDILFSHTLTRLAIVGTRNPDEKAKYCIHKLINNVSEFPVAVISGLALGIDTMVHTFSLRENIPNISFLGYGFFANNQRTAIELMGQIIKQDGVAVSEYFPFEFPGKNGFLQRNRLIAGMCDILIPVQGSVPSGTYSTVMHAIKMKKTILGVKVNNSDIEKLLLDKQYRVIDVDSKSDLSYLKGLLNCRSLGDTEVTTHKPRPSKIRTM